MASEHIAYRMPKTALTAIEMAAERACCGFSLLLIPLVVVGIFVPVAEGYEPGIGRIWCM
jgi:hypothetical protein